MVVVVTKPWEPEMRHVSQDLTGGVRCSIGDSARSAARVGGLSRPACQACHTRLARVLFPLVFFRRRVTEEGKTGEINPRGS